MPETRSAATKPIQRPTSAANGWTSPTRRAASKIESAKNETMPASSTARCARPYPFAWSIRTDTTRSAGRISTLAGLGGVLSDERAELLDRLFGFVEPAREDVPDVNLPRAD